MHNVTAILHRILTLAVSQAYWILYQAWQRIRRAAGQETPPTCMVLCYHSVRADEMPAFRRQLDELQRMARVVPAGEVRGLAPGSRYAALTFDDAFTTAVTGAIPEMVSRGLPCSVFVPSGKMGGPANWRQALHSRDTSETVASASDLRQLPAGLVAVGSHGVSHRNMCLLNEQEARLELEASRECLEQALGREIDTFVFPYGRHNASLVDMVRSAGYRRVFTGNARPARMTQDEFVIGRVRVDPSDLLWEFRLKVKGAYCWMPVMSALKGQMMRRLMRRSPERIEAKGEASVHFTRP